ncbi:cation transporter [candidate division KSB1 bacterium]|nr:cation transporter [candidate division KSB1 bacterium]
MKHPHRPKIRDSLDHLHEYRRVERNKLKLTMAITGSVMVIEVIGGILTNSLALLSDAGHMFTHFFALGISFGAIIIASKDPCHHRTFGFYRVEILAALFNSLFLFAVTAYILYEGIERLIHPESILGLQMFLVAVVGLIVNVISVLILRGSTRDDLNVRGAFLHMLADTVSSVVIVIGAIILYFTNWYIIDPLLGIGISLVIFMWAWGLFRDAINILLEAAPRGVNIDVVSAELKKEVPEIQGIHDMHIWVITSNMYSLTAHIGIGENRRKSKEVLKRINRLLNEKYDIEHTTIQFD